MYYRHNIVMINIDKKEKPELHAQLSSLLHETSLTITVRISLWVDLVYKAGFLLSRRGRVSVMMAETACPFSLSLTSEGTAGTTWVARNTAMGVGTMSTSGFRCQLTSL